MLKWSNSKKCLIYNSYDFNIKNSGSWIFNSKTALPHKLPKNRSKLKRCTSPIFTRQLTTTVGNCHAICHVVSARIIRNEYDCKVKRLTYRQLLYPSAHVRAWSQARDAFHSWNYASFSFLFYSLNANPRSGLWVCAFLYARVGKWSTIREKLMQNDVTLLRNNGRIV